MPQYRILEGFMIKPNQAGEWGPGDIVEMNESEVVGKSSKYELVKPAKPKTEATPAPFFQEPAKEKAKP